MSRSVVLRETPRCDRCLLPPRWCICPAAESIRSPVRIDVLMHVMESYRPSSTGHLIRRVLPDSRQHLYRSERPLERSAIVDSTRELWILHPQGEPLPPAPAPEKLQVLLLDGAWTQTGEMARRVAGWGRRVRLPMQGASRYWLRSQAGEDRFSTVEALLFLLDALGLRDTHAALRAQFELHVWASLRARGHKEKADAYLAASPARERFASLIGALTPQDRSA